MPITRTEFENELINLRERLLEMGGIADGMIDKAMRALIEQDINLSEQVIETDDVVDDMDLAIEGECIRLIALQAPVAKDLRIIGTALKLTTDLERICDNAVDIAKAARDLSHETFFKPLVDLPLMTSCVRQMLRDALSSFVTYNETLVNKVIKSDDEVDEQYYKLREELHAAMRSQPGLVVQASYLLFVAHYLERIADHVVNIAERVHYIETGNLAQLATSHKSKS